MGGLAKLDGGEFLSGSYWGAFLFLRAEIQVDDGDAGFLTAALCNSCNPVLSVLEMHLQSQKSAAAGF